VLDLGMFAIADELCPVFWQNL
jgi:hypothetical protein